MNLIADQFHARSRDLPRGTTLEIQLEEEDIFLVGSPCEAEDKSLKGHVVLCNTAPIRAKLIWVNFFGRYSVLVADPEMKHRPIHQHGPLRHWDEKLHQGSRTPIPPGRHVWPFEFPIRGYQIESLLGMRNTTFSYQVEAVMKRGRFMKGMQVERPVRIFRTFSPNSDLLHMSDGVDKIWPGKIKYHFSTPSEGVVFGSSVPCKLVLIPLRKGIRIRDFTISLVEKQDIRMKPDGSLFHSLRETVETLTIVEDFYTVPDDVESEDIDGHEGFVFNREIQIPKDLNVCRLAQDPVLHFMTSRQPYPIVKIAHALTFKIHLINNPEGYVSRITVPVPITLLLAPNQKLNANQQLLNSGAIAMGNNAAMIAGAFSAPPLYGQHETDETLDARSSIESGYATSSRGTSGRASATDLPDIIEDQELSANTLYNRLNRLVNPTSSQFATEDSTRQSILPSVLADMDVTSPSSVAPTLYSMDGIARATSSRTQTHSASGTHTPAVFEWDIEQMSRVPSYNTARRSSPPRQSSLVGLPTYEIASRDVSRDASRERGPVPAASLLQQEDAAEQASTFSRLFRRRRQESAAA